MKVVHQRCLRAVTNHTFGLTARFPFLGGEFPKVMKVIGAPGLLEVGFLSFFLASLGPQAPGKRGIQLVVAGILSPEKEE